MIFNHPFLFCFILHIPYSHLRVLIYARYYALVTYAPICYNRAYYDY